MSATTPIWKEPVHGGWPDPALFGLSGLDQLRSLLRGQVPPPPIAMLTGSLLSEVSSGTAAFTMTATDWLLSPTGSIAAGPLAIVADAALGCAIQSELPPATPYTTSELSLTMLRPVRTGSTLTAGGQTIHVGRSVALSEVFVVDEDADRLVAHGSSRCAVFPQLDRGPAAPAELPPVKTPGDGPHPFERPVVGEPVPQEAWDRMSGLEVLRAQVAGELAAPPIHHLTGINLDAIDEGEASFRLPCTEWLTSPLRTVQGGVTAMLADAALQTAILTTVPAGTAIAGLDIKVNYLRPVSPDGRDLSARGTVTHSGRTLAIAGAEVSDADGNRVALATGSAMFLPGRPANLRGEGELG